MSQDDTTASFTPSEYWQHYRQQEQHGALEKNRLVTESSPPPPMVTNVNAAHGTQDYQYHYQHRQSFSPAGSPWTWIQSPETPPSVQEDVMPMNQSLYDQQQYHRHHQQPSRQLSNTSSASTSSDVNSLKTIEISPQQQQEKQKGLRFHTVLQAMTAVTQKTESSLTYLNRNQCYGVQLVDKLGNDGLIHSEFTISFHDPAHQKMAQSYWKFWISQHKDPENARSLDLDLHQSIGILNVRYPSFDRIDFDWRGRHGAKLFVRFHCLSTDFSRIKGIKGIPLRICMSSQISKVDYIPMFQQNYTGSFLPNGKHETEMKYVEKSFCKVKLFRDKGAERKYKDDAKQLRKQFEKILHDGDSRKHPMWLMYNQSVVHTIFNPIPLTKPNEVSSTVVFNEITDAIKEQQQQQQQQHTKYQVNRQPPTLSHYKQQHPNHYHPYIKRFTTDISTEMLPLPPPQTLVPSTLGIVTVPTQLYFSGQDSVLSISSSSSSSSSSSPLNPDNDNGHSSIVAPNQQQKYDSCVVASPLFAFLDTPNQSKDMSHDNQQSFYMYYHQQQQQQ